MMVTPSLVGELFTWRRVKDLSAKTKQLKKENTKKKTVHSTTLVKQTDDLNFNWRAICDRRLFCPTLLSPIILFHFRKLQKCLKKLLINNTCIQSVSLKSHRHNTLGCRELQGLFGEKTSHFLASLEGDFQLSAH